MGLDTVELVYAVEAHFDVRIPNEQAAQMETVGKLLFWLRQELDRLGRTEWNDEALFKELRQVIHRQTSIPIEDIAPEARFVKDLRMN